MMPNFQRGFAIITAIFILVVLAFLGVAASSLFSMQQISAAQDVESVRILHAARTGREWGAYKVRNGPPPCAPVTHVMPATATSMSGITVTVAFDCSKAPAVYRIVSTACNQPSKNGDCPNTDNPSSTYIERQEEMYL